VISCKFCGRKHVRRKKECLAWGKRNSKCGEKNHFAVKCTKSSKSSTSKANPEKHKSAPQSGKIYIRNVSDNV